MGTCSFCDNSIAANTGSQVGIQNASGAVLRPACSRCTELIIKEGCEAVLRLRSADGTLGYADTKFLADVQRLSSTRIASSPISHVDNFDFVTDRLAIGSIGSSANPDFKAVVSLLTFAEREKAPQRSTIWQDGQGVDHAARLMVVDFANGQSGLEYRLPRTTSFIFNEMANGCVLVECDTGLGRSVAVVAAYLCRFAGMRLDEAIAFIRSRRQGACPADIFIAAITRWMRLDRLSHTGPRLDKRRSPG